MIYKLLGALFWVILLGSCSNNAFHDGKYKANIYNINNIYGSQIELMTIHGGEVIDEKYSMYGELLGKFKYTCIQFPDRVEISGPNNVTQILSSTNDSTLKLNELVVFNKIDERVTVKHIKTAPLIKVHGDKITLLPDKNMGNSSSGRLSKNESVNYREGSREFFDENDDWKIVVLIKGNKITLTTYPDDHNKDHTDTKKPFETIHAFIVKDMIVDVHGRKVGYRIENEILYKENKEGGENDYHQTSNE